MAAYERRLVAFIDVLGWTELVAQSTRDNKIFELLASLANQVAFASVAASAQRKWHQEWEAESPGLVPPLRVLSASHFSDCILLSCPLATAHDLVSRLQFICMSLLHAGHPARGAMVVGDIYHTETTAFGPALVHAYKLERDVAKYPRVIVDPGAIPHVNISVTADGTTYSPFLHQDFDGVMYLDRFPDPGRPRPQIMKPSVETLLAAAQARVESHGADLRLTTKHAWTVQYLKKVLTEFEE